jgi:hypothetical protein
MATFTKIALSGSTQGKAVKVATAATAATITNVTALTGTVTYTATNSFSAGQIVTITGVAPQTYNLVNATIATASGSNFTITNAATGTYISGGVATRQDMGSGTTIHSTGTSSSIIDEVWLYAYNSSPAPVTLTIQYGGTTYIDNDLKIDLPPTSGLTLIVPGLILTGTGSNANIVYAYATTANVVTISGYVNRIS